MTESPSTRKPLVSVVVPVYFEQEVIAEFYARTKTVFTGLADQYDHELLFVNDGSTDRSLSILQGLAAADPQVRILDLSRNFGHQLAVTAGLDYAAGDAVVIIDADLQDPPEVIVEMLAKWREGYKVVYGVRAKRAGESRFKLWTAAIFYRLLQRLSDTKIPLDTGDFRLIDRQVVEVVRNMHERSRYMRGLISWVGFRQFGLPYSRDRRFAGETHYTLVHMVKLAMDGLTNFSEKPLFLAGYFGLLVTGLSVFLICWYVIVYLMHPEVLVTGWTSLVLVILFLGGVQLLSLGLLGQYIGRIFRETKGRPLYIVGQVYGPPSSGPQHRD